MRAQIDVSKLLIEGRNRVDIFMYRPDNVDREHLGNLFIVGEIETLGRRQRDDFFVLNSIASIIKKTYYNNAHNSPEDNLELALKNVNNRITTLTERELGAIRDTFHFIVGVVAGRDLLFAKTGNSEVVLVRGTNWLNIGRAEIDQKPRGRYKFFSDIISGRLNNRDSVLFFTPRLTPFLSQESIRSKLASPNFDVEKSFIERTLVTIDPATSQAFVQLQVHLDDDFGSQSLKKTTLDKEYKDAPEIIEAPDMHDEPIIVPAEPKPSQDIQSEQIDSKHADIESFMQGAPPPTARDSVDKLAVLKNMSEKGWNFIKRSHEPIKKSFKKFVTRTDTFVDEHERDIQKAKKIGFDAGKKTFNKAVTGTKIIISKFTEISRGGATRLKALIDRRMEHMKHADHKESANQQIPLPRLRSHGNDKKRMYILAGFFAIAVIVLVSALIYQQRLLSQIEGHEAEIKKSQTTLDQLLADKQNNTIRLSDDQIKTRFTTLSLSRPFDIRGGFIRTSQTPRIVLVGDNSIYFANETTDINGTFIRYNADISPATHAVLLQSSNQLVLYSADTPNKFAFINLRTGEVLADTTNIDAPIQAVAGFADRLYALTQDQIYRYTPAIGVTTVVEAATDTPAVIRTTASLGPRTSWLNDDGALIGPISLAIDGSIHVLDSNATITSYLSGNKTLDIPVGNLFNVDQRKGRLAVLPARNEIVVINPSEQMLLIYGTGGELVGQLIHPSFETAVDAAYDAQTDELLVYLKDQIAAISLDLLE